MSNDPEKLLKGLQSAKIELPQHRAVLRKQLLALYDAQKLMGRGRLLTTHDRQAKASRKATFALTFAGLAVAIVILLSLLTLLPVSPKNAPQKFIADAKRSGAAGASIAPDVLGACQAWQTCADQTSSSQPKHSSPSGGAGLKSDASSQAGTLTTTAPGYTSRTAMSMTQEAGTAATQPVNSGSASVSPSSPETSAPPQSLPGISLGGIGDLLSAAGNVLLAEDKNDKEKKDKLSKEEKKDEKAAQKNKNN